MPIIKHYSYWNDFANVESELRKFIASHGQAGIMPDYRALKKADCAALSFAIARHGGYEAVAQRLGLQWTHTRKPRRYWNDFANIERELREFIAKYGESGIMPTDKALQQFGYGALMSAIQYHGGSGVIAQRMGLTRVKKHGYWSDFANVEREIKAFIDEQGQPGQMPTGRQLYGSGKGSLENAIQTHGGHFVVAERLGLKIAHRRRKRW